MSVRNRIVEHVTVRAGDLVPHPLNFRQHPEAQREALADSYTELGFARSLLGHRLADGRIQLIDGHLRAEHDPNMDVVVELLDVTQEEADKLLLTMDPLAALATTNTEIATRLQARVKTQSAALAGLWSRLKQENAVAAAKVPKEAPDLSAHQEERFVVLVECGDERQQKELLRRFTTEGLSCRAITSY